MGDYLTKDRILFERNHEGALLPVDVDVEFLDDKPKITLVPIMKGELAEYLSRVEGNSKDVEAEIMHKHLVRPKLTLDEAKMVRYDKGYTDAIIIAVIAVSTGMSQKEIKVKFEAKANETSDFTITPQTSN